MTRTLLRILPVLVLLALAAAPEPADAQTLNVRRMEQAPAYRTAEQDASFAEASAGLAALLDAQRAHYAAHGRFATSLDELVYAGIDAATVGAFAAEADWYVATVGDPAFGTMQHVVTLYPRDTEAADAAATVQRADLMLSR